MTATLLIGDWGYFLITISWLFSLIAFVISAYTTWKGIMHYQKQIQTRKDTIRQRGGSMSNKGSVAHSAPRKFLNMFILTITCMWLFTAINISDSIGLPHWIDNKNGDYGDSYEEWWYNWEYSDKSYLTWNVLWSFAKINLYLVYLYRVYSVFKSTKYNASSLSYICVLILLLIQFVFMCLWCWYYNISWSCCGIWHTNQYDILIGIAWTILFFDFVISLYLIHLFVGSMKRVLKSISYTINTNSGDNDPQTEIVYATGRIFTLAMISLISSIFYQVIFAIAAIGEFSKTHAHITMYYFTFTWNIDSALNVYCLFLSLTFAKQHYGRMCRWCDINCLSCLKLMSMIGNIEEERSAVASKSSMDRTREMTAQSQQTQTAETTVITFKDGTNTTVQDSPNKPKLDHRLSLSVSLIENDAVDSNDIQ